MKAHLILILLGYSLLVTSCTAKNNVKQNESNSCQPSNYGHRLGGDFQHFEDNTIEYFSEVAQLQHDRCFKSWEFDVNETRDNIVIFHDTSYNGKKLIDLKANELPKHVPTLDDLYLAFTKQSITKPIKIDLKRVYKRENWLKLKQFAVNLSKNTKQDVLFIVSAKQANNYQDFCSVLTGKFIIREYFNGPKLCESEKQL